VEKTPTKRGEAIELTGTEFQIRVWRELMKIPSGETKSYKKVAEAIGHPNSSRAVANACAKNPRPDVVPCHRVIRSDGGLGGYSGEGGVDTKLRLLNDEGAF
jgi:methylated-DNA-[protein]-cysteine S-methyltransferase